MIAITTSSSINVNACAPCWTARGGLHAFMFCCFPPVGRCAPFPRVPVSRPGPIDGVCYPTDGRLCQRSQPHPRRAGLFIHALSTHRADDELDFFAAVDDPQKAEESGAGMTGTLEFTPAATTAMPC